MKPKLLLTVAAIYMGIIGILLSVFPSQAFSLAPDAPAALVARMRLPGGLFLALALMNWFARNSDASSGRDAIFIGNTAAFAFVAIVDLLITLVPGGNPSGWAFVLLELLFAISFFLVGRANTSTVAK